MSRMEVVAGPGTAARFGDVCIWAGPEASALLVSFLVESARNVGASPLGGARIADHIGRVLAGRDPEPGIPFASVGPGEAGTAVLLHGAIQAWDGSRWLVPQPRPGWLRTEVAGPAPITVTAHGAVGMRAAPASDLRGGVVPAAGFSLVPGPDPASATTLLPAAALVPAPSAVAAPTPPTTVLAAAPPVAAGESTVVDTTELVDALRQVREQRTDRTAQESAAAGADPSRNRPPGSLDLNIGVTSPLPPLPAMGQPEAPAPGQPVVAGVLCPVEHFNHPAVRTCVVCGKALAAGSGRVSGSRPSLGVLVVDDGGVYRLERSYLIGSAPDSDPTVTGGRARSLTLTSGAVTSGAPGSGAPG
ncbi:MAG: hypothetical protein M3137_06180, partial [Actinomycetota bacterium]|nr:hypothetical protein [Actinomycetota bacterium]